jgi:hypothetical protein
MLSGFFLRRLVSLPVAATICVCLFATASHAGVVTASLDSYSNPGFSNLGDPVVKINNGAGGTTFTTYGHAGSFNWTGAVSTGDPALPSSFQSFCVDVNHAVFAGTTYTFTTSTLGPSSGTGFNTSDKVSAVQLLWGGFYGQISSYTYNGSVNPEINGAAFQLAIWKLEYDYVSGISDTNLTNFGAGNFQATASKDSGLAAISLAQILLAAVNDGTFTTAELNLVTMTNDTDQAQLTVTPEPSSICLSFMGVGAFVFARYRRRKGAAEVSTNGLDAPCC